jgi:hypothetical protein
MKLKGVTGVIRPHSLENGVGFLFVSMAYHHLTASPAVLPPTYAAGFTEGIDPRD